MTACANCGTEMVGEYCQACGQKRFVESDRRFGHLLHQFLASATDLDGRIVRTLRALLFQPGLLSHDYIEGRRARWVAPITLFLAMSVVYFLAPLHGGDLSLQFDQQVDGSMRALASDPGATLSEEQLHAEGQIHSRFTRHWIEQRVHERDAAARIASDGKAGYTYRDYRIAYNAKADDVSKALILLHVPFTAFVLMLLFARKHRYFAEHFVVALHFFSFVILALQITVQTYTLLKPELPPSWFTQDGVLDWFMRTWLSAYTVISLHRAYETGWLSAAAAAAVMLATTVMFNLWVYRAVEFALTFALT